MLRPKEVNYERINESDREYGRSGNAGNPRYQASEDQTDNRGQLRTVVLCGPYCTDLSHPCYSVGRPDPSDWPFVERLDGPLAINSANGAGQEPRTLQRTAVAAWRNAGDASEDASQMMLVGKAARQCHLS
jgi:hypothetical protein